MSFDCNMQDTSEDINETIIKQENTEIKLEVIDNESDIFNNVPIKQEMPSYENHIQENNSEVSLAKGNTNMLISIENEITNIYDDNIDIKHEYDMHVNDNDDCSMDSKDAEALHNVETCLEDNIIKLENETYEANQTDALENVAIKREIETFTETNVLSNEIEVGTGTLFMEILPMNINSGVPLGKVDNPEAILSTSYNDAMDYTNSIKFNSITGNMITLEQEAYSLLEAKEAKKAKKVDKIYTCSKCPKTFKNSIYQLKKHEKYHQVIENREYKAKMLQRKKDKTEKKEKKKITVAPRAIVKEGYECTCGKFYQRKTRQETCLRSHNTAKDHNSSLFCGTCCKQFKDKEELLLHRKQVHQKAMFPCKFCPTDYKNRKELFKHLQIHQKVQVMEYQVLSEIVQGKQKLKCFMCAKTCTNLTELKSHVMYDHKEPYVCQHCNKTFSKIIQLGNHTKTYHPDVEGNSVLNVLKAFSKLIQAWKCKDCDVQFADADKLALHKIEKHSNEWKVDPQFQCIDCRRVYISLKGLMSHRRIHHITEAMEETRLDEKGVLCMECRKVCRDMDALTCHMRLHSQKRKYPCKFCDFRFASAHKRKVHAELHTGDMKYVCFICEYRCSSLNRLNQHKKSAKHLSTKAFLSTGKALGVEQSISKSNPEKEEWMVVKGDENECNGDGSSIAGGRVTCDICGQIFTSTSKMLEHQETHPFIEIPNEDKPTRIFFK